MTRKPFGTHGLLRRSGPVRRFVPLLLGLALTLTGATAWADVAVVAQFRLGEEAANGKVPAVVESAAGTAKLESHGEFAVSEASPDARGSKASVVFDGKTTWFSAPGVTDDLDNFGVEAFVNPSTNEGFQVIVRQGSAAHGWSLVRNNKGYQILLGGVQLVGWSGDFEAGQWSHVAMVRVGGVTKLFVDGQEKGQSNAVPNAAGRDAPFTIGGAADGKTDLFAGKIDEVRVFKLVGGGFDPADLLMTQPDVSVIPQAKPAAVNPQPGSPANRRSADGLTASIKFDASPVEAGIEFRRQNIEPTTVDGREGWVVKQGSADDVPWARSVLLTVTDPKFRNGAMPVVDIEVDFLQTFNAPVEIRGDTERGSTILGGSWGNNPHWKTFKVSLDDAQFASTQRGSKPGDMNTDGFDLRINSFGGDFVIGGVRLSGYDMDVKPDYRRLLRLESINTPTDIFAFEPGKSHVLTYTLRNLARKALPAKIDIDLRDRAGNVLYRVTKNLTIEGRQRTEIPFTVDATSLSKGVYDVNMTVRQTDAPESPIVLVAESYVAVTDTESLPKAKPGEFLYGLDVKLGPAYGETRLLRWSDLMGADIIRHGFGWEDDINELNTHMSTFDQHGLSVMLMCDPPKDLDAGTRASKLPGKMAFLETAARQFPQIKFFELGNEPDLRFFYPGEIKDYVADFEQMSRAVKRGNPEAFVMNGGLSFAGAEAIERSRELVKLTDASTVDGWAYHGHGVGIEAERSAWNRMQAVAESFGKGDKPLVETESGMAARTRSQEDVQARTVVQKMVFAQSKKMPLFMWFRLLMYEEDYGTLRNEKEPRPALLAYRSMVKSLRGLKFEKVIENLPSGMEGFVFRDDSSARAAVLWSDSSQPRTVLFALKGAGAAVVVRDLNGNDRDALFKDGVVKLVIGQDPVFVIAKSDSREAQLAVLPSMLEMREGTAVIRGGSGVIGVVVNNPFDVPLSATLLATAPDESTFTADRTPVTVDVPARAKTEVAVNVNVAADPNAVRWPNSWRVYPGAKLPANLSSMVNAPASLPGTSGNVEGVKMTPENFRIDFEKAGGKIAEKNPGIAIAVVESPVDQTVRVGASADWWMAWHVNGKKVYDTLEAGNGAGYAITDHIFDVPLKKGKNVVVVQVLSGSQGWKLLVGDPAALRKAQGKTVDRLEVVLSNAAGDPLDKLSVEPRVLVPLVKPEVAWPGKPTDWDVIDADEVLSESTVRNEFAKQPDASKWWKGGGDLSGRVWLRADEKSLFVVVAVRDQSPIAGADGDRVRLKLEDAAEVRLPSPTAQVFRVKDTSWYFVRLPRAGVSTIERLSIEVDDVDGAPGVVKQTASLPSVRFGWPMAE